MLAQAPSGDAIEEVNAISIFNQSWRILWEDDERERHFGGESGNPERIFSEALRYLTGRNVDEASYVTAAFESRLGCLSEELKPCA